MYYFGYACVVSLLCQLDMDEFCHVSMLDGRDHRVSIDHCAAAGIKSLKKLPAFLFGDFDR